MFSFKERMKTFASWPENYGVATPEGLSIAGFICLSTEENNLTVECVYCNKTLECWERTDMPAKEHYLHMNSCPLFNVNRLESRVKMFNGWSLKEAKALARMGFVKYNLGESDFIFCYKCGSINRSHLCERKRGHPYSLEKRGSVFFYDLIEGIYNKELVKLTEYNVYIPQHTKEFLKEVTGGCLGSVFRSVEDVIEEYMGNKLFEIDKAMSHDIERALDEVVAGIGKKSLG
ncbi:uncharacterized protein Eint_050680 [Encephalitozoon intestinalis ATCC 50506]|uniref:Uncharacterized protein n=1 Tax=Encephalitozoon intestinalis (strain ATCC 50506) TaxID=876142 RepID=E0S788_ENCIT|nr:uncharacterized protein Eint_050680 [Encephalitozoon intestinalis ATCC 50506]ADM11516.1 hypothetical protein Eint_050680 [Encephalitozoon intestinalis ATCC 50506]UTX45229.1 baculoviral inhibition of apoptosis protein repeat domain-containing protein [Encephalitozoon intestinalis]